MTKELKAFEGSPVIEDLRAMQLFYHLKKLHTDTVIDQNEIFIPLLQVRIRPPYQRESVYMKGNNSKAIERVQALVTFENFQREWGNGSR